MAATEPRLYRHLKDFVPEGIPFSGLLVSALETFDALWIGELSFEPSDKSGSAAILVQVSTELKIPGVDMVSLVFSPGAGGLEFTIEAGLEPSFHFALRKVSLELRIKNDLLRVVKDNSRELDPDRPYVAIRLDEIDLSVDAEGRVSLALPQGISLPRCMIGSTGIIISASGLNWLTPEAVRPDMPAGFTGFYIGRATLDIPDIQLPANDPEVVLKDVYIGTGGVSGRADFTLPGTWTPATKSFAGPAAVQLFGFAGCLTHVGLELRQGALTGCIIEGAIYAPYVKRVIGLSIGFDGAGGLTAIAQAPSASIGGLAQAAGPPKPGYILSADIERVFTFDVSRIEFHAGGSAPASLSLSGRVKLIVASIDLPAVEFKGLSIDTRGQVAIEGGWLDVAKAKSGPLKGFPLQITRIGFGLEQDGRAWVGLNGSIKLHESLPMGVSVEGLKVSWKEGEPVNFSLEGIGVQLAVKGTFSFVGKVAFFQTDEASGFRGSIKLTLDSVGLKIDAGILVGRMNDGTFFFYLYIDVDLPVGVPLFSTGAALYGFAGLLAVNLQPARIEAEHWYHGYYKRLPVGLTAPEKWAVKRDAFALGVGTTIGSMPDTGYAVSAKVLLILSLPGPRIFLQGKGSIIEKKPENKDERQEGAFEALLVLDTPAKLFQANLAVMFKMGALLEVGGGVDAAFSWDPNPPADAWHVYLGEKDPVERRVHARVLEFLKGDAWLMVNRPHYFESADALARNRLGDFELGGSLLLGVDFDFVVVKMWLRASIFAQAAVTWEPQQIMAGVRLNGSAGISVLGMELSAELTADALVKASKPFYFGASVEVELRVNLIFIKWEFHEKVSIEYTRPEVPDYVRDFVALKADHMKASEARELQGAVVPPDFRPVVVFSKPVRDLAWFGAPGDPDLPPEDLHARQVSYQLRHVVLLANDGTVAAPVWRFVSAGGRARVSGATIEFTGIEHPDYLLPDLAGTELRLFNTGDRAGQVSAVSAGGGSSATIAAGAPQGELCYRVSAPRAAASVVLAAVAEAGFGQVEATLAGPLQNPQRFRGGVLTSGGARWTIADASTTTVRLQLVTAAAPAAGSATLAGPDPAQLAGAWQAAGEPVEGGGSSTRLQVWARTPYAMFRYNELETLENIDALAPGYACGPTPVEAPVCTRFEDLPPGPLAATFTAAGLPGASDGSVNVLGAAGAPKTLVFVRARLTLSFDPPADAVWVSAAREESGVIRAFSGGAMLDQQTMMRRRERHRFAGGIDRIEIEAQDATVEEVCFTPGWTCVGFENSFPGNLAGVVTYAGLRFGTAAILRVTRGVLHVVPRKHKMSGTRITRSKQASRFGPGTGGGMPLIHVPGLQTAFVAATPLLGEVHFTPAPQSLASFGPRELKRAVLDRRAPPEPPPKRIAIHDGTVWHLDTFAALVTLTVEFPRPVTRARFLLGGQAASLVALAGTLQAATATGAAGTTVALHADPHGAGWFDRVVVTAAGEIQIREICTDRGDFGWQRYQQWTWRQGVQRSIESLYADDPVLPPGKYALRVHTAAVVTGEQPVTMNFVANAAFEVGAPPGLARPLVNATPAGADPRAWTYPHGGPLTQAATYVAGTMPADGARLWYRSLDTAVRFNENYVTRMYLEADEELRVFVRNASDVALRNGTRHVWGTGEAALDATTSLYVRTLAGDGTENCASVDIGRIVLPEAVTAGAGELLEPSALHRSQLRTRRSDAVVHEFEFTTSLYASFLQLAATYDGLCPRLAPRPQDTSWDPRAHAQARSDAWAQLESARAQAVSTMTAGRAADATSSQIEAAAAAPGALAATRASTAAAAAALFARSWSGMFEAVPPPAPAGLRLSVVRAGHPSASDLLLLESPEPIAWDRVSASIRPAAASPLTRRTVLLGRDFGRPDRGFEVAYGGLLWRAGVELWFDAGALRARAAEPLDLTLVLPRSASADLVLRADAAGNILFDCDPAAAQVTVTALPEPGTFRLLARAPAQATLKTLRVRGLGVGIASCTVDTPFRPRQATGPLRIVAARLPVSANDLTHEITLLAMAPVSLQGWSVRWVDPGVGGASQLYARCTAALALGEARRVRLVPSLASAPATDDALVLPGGAGTAPPAGGAVFQLVDPAGVVAHEYAAMAPGGAARRLAILPDADGSRAVLVPPPTEAALSAGSWQLTLSLAGDLNAPDLDRWTVGGRVVADSAVLPLLIEAEPAIV